MNNIKGNVYTENYSDIDTNQKHNLIIYNYSIGDKEKDEIVIGEILDNNINTSNLINCLNKIIDCHINRNIQMFACSYIKMAKSTNLFENINFSKNGYDFIFNGNMEIFNNTKKLNYSEEDDNDFLTKLEEIVIIDHTSKRFSSIGFNQFFYPLNYYEDNEQLPKTKKEKCLTYQN